MNSGPENPSRPDDNADSAELEKTIQSEDFGSLPDAEELEEASRTVMIPDSSEFSSPLSSQDGEFSLSQKQTGPADSADNSADNSPREDGMARENSADSQTLTSDDSFPSPVIQPSDLSVISSQDDSSINSAMQTVASHDESYASAPHTILSDDDFDLQDPGRTYQSADMTADSGQEASAQTLVSDGEVNQILSRTWGAGINTGTNPAMTIKATELSSPVVMRHDSIPERRLEKEKADSLGEYELLKVLGEGGMGIVWNARQRSVERNVAIKMIKSAIATKARQTEKFIAEAIVTGDLEHPNIIPIHELGKDQQGNYFYAMKHVQGTPWNKVIKVMPLHENLDVLLRTCDAIAFAHARGIIHRDLKPENIMLGDYGEVLVMDWGLALPTEEFSKKELISRSHGMGGTPAYMAPEMATGPISRVNYTSDVYLLGAILYEIVTGHPPHRGKTTQQCLAAAMRNIITPVTQESELLEIAMKAMETDSRKRHKTVKQFQSAVRNYLAHEKSLEISRRATREYHLALESEDYTSFSRSLFGYEEALALWSDNEEANEGLLETRLHYARTALKKGDYDLAESLSDETDPDHEQLIADIRKAKADVLARQRMLRIAKQTVAGLAVTILLVVGVSYYLINLEIARAIRAEKEALDQRLIAEEQWFKAQEQSRIAENNAQVAMTERARAEERELEANTQRLIAVQEKENAELARQAEQYESYVARIGLAAAKVEENAFSDARELLLQCPEELRNWEWGRLMYLCSQSSREYEAEAPVDGLALSPDSLQFVTASWDGKARIWDRESGDVLKTLAHSSIYVHAVDWSADGRLIVTGSADTDGNLKLWEAASGKLLAALHDHADAVIGVRFSDNGQWLISTSYDNTAKLWNISNPQTPELRSTLVGHTWWVWSADFSPGFDPQTGQNRLVTVGQDGKAIVWEITDAGRIAKPVVEFLEHTGPVYSVAFHPSGNYVATGGYDRLIHLWNPAEIQPFDFAAAVSGKQVNTQYHRSLTGHIGPVRCLNFSQSGNLLVSGAQDNAVRIWQMETGASIKTFRGHDSAVRACAISTDGRYIFSAAEDQMAILWSVNDYAEIHTLAGQELTGHGDAILSAYFSPSGQEVITASRDRSARIWNTRTGEQQRFLAEGHQFLSSVAVFLSDEQYLATAAADNTVRLWNTSTGSEIGFLQGTGRTGLLAVSDDQRWLATGGEQADVLIWDTQTLLAAHTTMPEPVARLKGHNRPVTAIRFVPGSNQLVSGDTHGRCILWETLSEQPVWSVRHHTMKITALGFTQAGTHLLSASLDRTIGRTDLANGEEIAALVLKAGAPVVAMATSGTGDIVVAVTNEQTEAGSGQIAEKQLKLYRWDLTQADSPQSWTLENQAANSLSLNAAGTIAYLTTVNNTLIQWNLASGNQQELLTNQQQRGLLWSSLLSQDERRLLTIGGVDARLWEIATGQERMSFGPHGAVAATAMHPEEKTVVTGSWDQSLKFWNAETGQSLRKITQAHTGYINTVAYSPDGRWLVTGGDDRIARIWNADTGEELVQLKGHTGDIHRALFSPNNSLVLTASGDRTLRLWDRETGQQLGEPFRGHRWGVLAADFSPDGTRMISSSDDNKAILWDVASRQPITELSGHTAAVTSVRFSPDGQRVLTSSRDNTAKLWDVSSGHEGNEILTLKRHAQEVTAVDFSRDSLQVLTASRDGTAVLWPAIDWRIPKVAHQNKSEGTSEKQPQ